MKLPSACHIKENLQASHLIWKEQTGSHQTTCACAGSMRASAGYLCLKLDKPFQHPMHLHKKLTG